MIYKSLFSSVVGSKLHRTNLPTSDTDARVVYRDSLEDRLSPLGRGTTTYTSQYTDITYFELTHFAKMLGKCNPTTIEILFGLEQEGDIHLMQQFLVVSMDTELYIKQCNGMIMGMLSRATPKRLHHAARIHTHLTKYANCGILDFNAANYDNYGYLCAVKRGDAEFDQKYAEKVEVGKIWHQQNLSELNSLVVGQYSEDAS